MNEETPLAKEELEGANSEYYQYFKLREWEKGQTKRDVLSMKPVTGETFSIVMNLFPRHRERLTVTPRAKETIFKNLDQFCLRGTYKDDCWSIFTILDEEGFKRGTLDLSKLLMSGLSMTTYQPLVRIKDKMRSYRIGKVSDEVDIAEYGKAFVHSMYSEEEEREKRYEEEYTKMKRKARKLLQLLDNKELIIRVSLKPYDNDGHDYLEYCPLIERPWRRNIKVIHRRK